MVATSLAEQQLAEIPVLKDASFTDASGSSLISTVLSWLKRGVKVAFCILNDGCRVVFLGEDGKLFELQRPEASEGEDGAPTEMPTPKEVFHGREAWKLPDDPDLSAVCVTSTNTRVFVVDSHLQLFAETVPQSLSRCLPSHHVAQVACGLDHVLVLTTDGGVRCSGSNNSGQLGLGHYEDVQTSEMEVISLDGFATGVACGASHSVVILCKGQAAFFGEVGDVWASPEPTELESPVGPPVKVACGANHTLLLTAGGRLAGFGKSDKNQLGKLGDTDTLLEIPFKSTKGRPVDIFCHPKLDASVVLTATDKLYVCGDVGALFNLQQPIPTFLHYQKPAVILGGAIAREDDEEEEEEEEGDNDGDSGRTMVCMRPPTGTVMIPGFNDPELCEIEVVPTASAKQFSTPAALDLTARLPRDSLRRLVERSVSKHAALLPSDIHQEYMDRATPASQETAALAEQSPHSESVFISLHAIRVRSCYLWSILQSDLTGDISQTEDRKKRLSLSKYSPKTVQAYGRYLHEDVVETDAAGAIELLELAREYGDETGLGDHCARVARRLVREKDLPLCLRKCIELHHMALAVDLVKLQLCVKNCCEVLQVAEMGSPNDPYAEYIRNIAMQFALAHVRDVVNSAGYQHMDSTLQGRMFFQHFAF